jgi:hypothetical protein
MRILVSGSVALVRSVADRYPDSLGHITTPSNFNTPATLAKTGLPFAADNGAYSGLDAGAFRKMLNRIDGLPNLLWVVCPDVVGDASATLRMFEEWRPILGGLPVAFAAQDGLEALPVPWERFCCLFVGGSTQWKLGNHAARLIAEAKDRGKQVHMGRVNTQRRLRYARDIGCDTADGSIFSKMSDKFLLWAVRFVQRERQQPVLWG